MTHETIDGYTLVTEWVNVLTRDIPQEVVCIVCGIEGLKPGALYEQAYESWPNNLPPSKHDELTHKHQRGGKLNKYRHADIEGELPFGACRQVKSGGTR